MFIQGKFRLPENLVDELMMDEFPWYFQKFSTSTKFPFMSHTVVRRPKFPGDFGLNSNKYFPWVLDAINRFCIDNDIEYTEILRCAFNFMWGREDYLHTDPHVDMPVDHKVIVAHLNESSGGTIIYHKKYTEGEREVLHLETLTEELPIYKIADYKKGHAVCFDGAHYHANYFCKQNEVRLAMVACIR